MAPIYGNPLKVEVKNKEVTVDKYLHGNLLEIKDMISKKFDGVIVIDGMEGSGKSELAFQTALIVDPNFTSEGVVYTPDQFYERVDTSKPGDAIVWDEFVMAGTAAESLTKMQTALKKKFTIIRKKGLFIVLVIPYIFMLQKYFAIARTRCLINVFTVGKTRGYFKFYDYFKKQMIYVDGVKTWFYPKRIAPNFAGRFGKWSENYLDHEYIDKLKDETTQLINDQSDSTKFTEKQMRYVKLMAEQASCPFIQNSNDHKNWYLCTAKVKIAQSEEDIDEFKKDKFKDGMERINHRSLIRWLKENHKDIYKEGETLGYIDNNKNGNAR